MFEKFYTAIFALCGAFVGLAVWIISGDIIRKWFAMVMKDAMSLETQAILLQVMCVILFAMLFAGISSGIRVWVQKAAGRMERNLQNVPTSVLLPSLGGLILGFVIARLLCGLFNGLVNPYLDFVLSLGLYVLLGYLGIRIVGRRGRSMMNSRMFHPDPESIRGGKKKKGAMLAPKVLDTGIFVDGRIVDLLHSGFLEGEIIIPEFVLVELQHLADSSDALKRAKGRRGLDVVAKVQSEFSVDVYDTSGEKGLEDIAEVDIKLLKLARNMNATLVTLDYNLNKLARIEGVKVLNINQLAKVLKPVVIPGDKMQVDLLREGTEPEQGVAYMEDGTMVVVEGGKSSIGRTIEVVVTTVLQTASGRIIFAKPR